MGAGEQCSPSDDLGKFGFAVVPLISGRGGKDVQLRLMIEKCRAG